MAAPVRSPLPSAATDASRPTVTDAIRGHTRVTQGHTVDVSPDHDAAVCIRGLCGGLESDVESHRGQLGDVVAELSLGDDPGGVVVGAEVVKSGEWVRSMTSAALYLLND